MVSLQPALTRRTEVFISAASADLKSTRALVKQAVDTIGCHGVYQEVFPPDYRTVGEMLRNHIKNCDAVIHIAGISYGSEPRDRPADKARRSFTQMEYDIAQELGRPLYVFVCGEGYPYDAHPVEPADAAALQQAHREACLGRSEIWEKVSSPGDLNIRVSQLQENLKKLERQVLDKRKGDVRAKLNLAQTLARQEKLSEGIRELEEALALAQAGEFAQEEVEILLALGLLSSSRRGIGNRRGYLDQAEKKIGEIKDAVVRVLYFRAEAAACHDERNHQSEESALRSALRSCENAKDDEEYLRVQACVVRSELAILLCNADRHTEATELILACDLHARAHPDSGDGELMQAAMSAGIFWALKSNNEEDAVSRLEELEASAKTANQAGRIASQLQNMANSASRLGFHRAAIVAAEGSLRLAQKSDSKNHLLGALYTVACATFHAGDHATAKRKAESLLDACNDPKDAVIKQAANHMIAEIVRGAGDSETAVAFASNALASASGQPEEIAFTKQAVARALSDNGQTEEALVHASEAYELMKAAGVPAPALADVLLQMVSYSSALGMLTRVSEALHALSQLKGHGQEIGEMQERAPKLAEMNKIWRERIVQIATSDEQEFGAREPIPESLEKANAQVVQPLLDLWDAIPKAYTNTAATAYDFWGRGNFARILQNAQTIRSALNITLEVRTLDGLKQAIRLWALYSDMLLLIWKGPTQDVKLLDVLPDLICEAPGGAGYFLSFAGKDDSGRHLLWCMTDASLLPAEVIAFLMTDARPLLAAGRLIVVPAIGVGCVHPGHGPLEQLLTESANAIAGLRRSEKSHEVPIGMMPYSPDAPIELLADIVQEQQGELRKLRRLLIKRTRELAPNEAGIISSKELELEIDDALRDLADQQIATARKHGLSSTKEPLSGGFCRFHSDGSRLLPGSDESVSPFAPLLTLQNFGYKWGVGLPGAQPHGRYEPGEKSVAGPWLALPTERWSLLVVKSTSDPEEAGAEAGTS